MESGVQSGASYTLGTLSLVSRSDIANQRYFQLCCYSGIINFLCISAIHSNLQERPMYEAYCSAVITNSQTKETKQSNRKRIESLMCATASNLRGTNSCKKGRTNIATIMRRTPYKSPRILLKL